MSDRPALADTPKQADTLGRSEPEHHAPSPPERPTHPVQPLHPPGILPAVQSLLYLLVVAMFLMTFTAQPIRIPSASMEPTLLVGDFLLLDKQSVSAGDGFLLPPVSIKRGDVVVFHDPVDDPSIHLVKRIVAVPGDRLHLHHGQLFLNGVAQVEPYAIHRAGFVDPFRDDFPSLQSRDAVVNSAWWIALRTLVRGGELTVPAGEYFVMGDNRDNSEDSRYWGFVPRNAIVGKPLLIYFSWRDPARRPPSDSSPGQTAGEAGNRPGSRTGEPASRPGVHEQEGFGDFARWDRIFQVVH